MVTEMNMRLKGPMCERGKLRIFVASGTSRIHFLCARRWADRHIDAWDTAPLDAVSRNDYPAGVIASASCSGA